MRVISGAEGALGNDAWKSGEWGIGVNAGTFSAGIGLVLAAVLAFGATACGAGNVGKAGNTSSKPLVLTLADGADHVSGDTSDAQPFAAAVWKLSHGTLQIKIEGNWRANDAYYETGLINDVRAGKAQLGIAASRAFDTVGITSFQALQGPFLIDNYPLERKVLGSGIPGRMLQGLRPHGLVGLAVLPGPLRRPFGFTAGIYQGNDAASVADLCLRGIKVVSASPADLAGLRAALRPLYRTLESNPATKMFINQITAMRQAVGGAPGAVTCPRPAQAGSAPAEPRCREPGRSLTHKANTPHWGSTRAHRRRGTGATSPSHSAAATTGPASLGRPGGQPE